MQEPPCDSRGGALAVTDTARTLAAGGLGTINQEAGVSTVLSAKSKRLSITRMTVRASVRIRDCLLWLEERPLAVLAGAAGAAFVVWFLLAASVGWPRVAHVLYAPHSWEWLWVCFVAELIAYFGYVLTIRDIARVDSGPKMSLRGAMKTVVAGFGVFAATRAAGGFAVDYWAFRRGGAAKRDAVGRVFALGLLELTTLSIVVLVASIALYTRIDGDAGYWVTLPSLLIVPLLALGFWLTSHKRADRLSRIKPSHGWVRRTVADSVAGARTLRTMISRPRAHGLGALGMVIYWAGDICCLWAALQLAGGGRMTLAALVLAYSGVYVLSRRSLPAGGAGIVEVALVFALAGMGAPLAPALLAVLIYRFFNFWLPIVPALMLIPAIRELRGEFQRAERELAKPLGADSAA
jgi:uncharacterized membrane protein YbhN (UPF0104 family)